MPPVTYFDINYMKLATLINNFLFLIKKANLKEILEAASPEIKQFIESLDKEKKQFYINYLLKNPNSTLEELIKNTNLPKENTDISLPFEQDRVNNRTIKNWALIQFRKLRKGKKLPNWLVGSFNNRLLPEADLEVWERWINEYEFRQGFKPDEDFMIYVDLFNRINEIEDWVRAENIEIASYTAKQAIEQSDRWHRQSAQEGKNKKYQEGTSNVVYGPTWKNSKYNGWTIKEIKTPNDLDVEGYLMDHCVGSYADLVAQGDANIYSLRDPGNKPHVTIEAKIFDNDIDLRQIKGKSNSEPKSEYKAMVKEWFQELQNNGKKLSDNENDRDYNLRDVWDTNYAHRIGDLINEVYNQDNEYGIRNRLYGKFDVSKAFENIKSNLVDNWGREKTVFARQIPSIAEAFFDAVINHDKEVILNARENHISKEMLELRLAINKLEEIINKEHEDFYERAWENFSSNFPWNDYSSEEEALQAEQDAFDEYYKYEYENDSIMKLCNHLQILMNNNPMQLDLF